MHDFSETPSIGKGSIAVLHVMQKSLFVHIMFNGGAMHNEGFVQ